MKNKSLRRDARAAQRKVPAELARSPAARTPDGVLDYFIFRRETEMIRKTAIVGMGALGLLFGQKIAEKMGPDNLYFIMDEARKERHLKDTYIINGQKYSFHICSPDDISEPVDLIIIATKYNGLYEARDMIRPLVGEQTVIVSLLNGISSEDILAERYSRAQIIDTVAIGMDAVRSGTRLSYKNPGKWQIGITDPAQKDLLEELAEFLALCEIAYEVCTDIRHAMWNKFMINVGINQTCMLYETNYGGATRPGEAFRDMERVMHEVIDVAEAEGIALTQDDYEKDLKLLRSLDPELYPSMRQDALAKRRTEVELFSGTVLRIAEKYGIPVPANEKYYHRILQMEKSF